MFLEIISPDKKLFEGEIKSVSLPGSDGSLGILNNHAPMISESERRYLGELDYFSVEIADSGGPFNFEL